MVRFAELIEQGGERLLETLDAVLNLSKLEAEEMEIVLRPLDFVGQAEEMAALFEQQAEEEVILEVEDTGRGDGSQGRSGAF